jgi:hypothetical protein
MSMPTPVPVSVPDSVPTGTAYRIGSRTFTATRSRAGERVWVGRAADLGPTILLQRRAGDYLVAPWLEGAAPHALGAMIRSGALVPPNPLGALTLPSVLDDAEDAAMRVAVIEALLETRQVSLDDALSPLKRWRTLRDRRPGRPTPLSSASI